MTRRFWLILVAVLAIATLPAQPPALEVVLRQARQEISDFKKAGGKNSDPAHPAEKWAKELWKWRDASPGTPEAAKATTEAVRFLVYADRFTEVQERVDSIPPDDPAWQSLAGVLFDSASRQKNYTYFFAKLESVLNAAKEPNTRAAVDLNLGRAWRERRDNHKAETALRAAIDLAPDSRAGKAAERQLYELLHLSAGQPAPLFSTETVTGAHLSLADYRGKPVVLVFWGTY